MLSAGDRLGPYEIVAAIGAGGMGEVYRARDTKLNRDVAVKVLPELLAGDADRLARFHREAQIVASLNHPNIAHTYGLEDAPAAPPGVTPIHALVMELVDGPTLADRIAEGPVPVAEALAIVKQIAEALEAAHEHGIVHRDLKPGNVKVRPDGTVKVLDFGLAKMLETGAPAGSGAGVNPSISPTLTARATLAGMILGTAAYMSPEQARGRAVDKRTDVWGFGCVLFEMLSGARAFEGDDIAETIGAVIHKEPAWSKLPGDTPPTVRLVLQRCLEKDPKRRVRDVGDVQLALGGAFDAPAAPNSAARERSKRRSILYAASAAAVAAGITGAAAWLLRPSSASRQTARFIIVPPAARPFNLQGFFRQLAISPDGTHIVYAAGADSQLMLRAIDQLDAVPLRDAIGGFPFFSPDGRWIGFFAGLGGEIRKVSIRGGPALTICRYQGAPRGASWGTDDTIVFATNDVKTGLMSVSAGGGEPKVLTTPDRAHGEADHWLPSMAPDGRHVFFTITNPNGSENAQVAVLDVQTGERKTLIRGGNDGAYIGPSTGSEPGYLIYASSGVLHAAGFSLSRLSVIGDPVPVVEQVAMMQSGASDFGVSRNGTLVYVPGAASTGVTRRLAWVSRDGHEEPLDLPERPYTFARLSPDETRVALAISDQENDVWIHDLRRKTTTRLTSDPNVDNTPVWSPDGQRIVFGSNRSGAMNIYSQRADGTGSAERLTTSPVSHLPGSFSPDGRSMVFQEGGAGLSDLMLLRFDPPRVEPLLPTPFAEAAGDISPDGRWIAYYSNESGISEVFVRPFPKLDGGRWPISNGGGSRPAWSKDGKELFYFSGATAMMAVPVQLGETFSAGTPKKLFDGPWYVVQSVRPYDISRDGKKFLMIKSSGGDDQRVTSPTMTVVLDWIDELKAKVPVK